MKNQRKTLVYAHRGGSGDIPENTLASFRYAISHNVDGIETDLRATKDHVIVLSHDPEFIKNGVTYHIDQLRYKELLLLKPDIVTLEQFVVLVNHRTRMMLEVKEMAAVPETVTIVKHYLATGYRPEEFIFASFEYPVLKKLRVMLPAIDLVVLEQWSGIRAISRARSLGTPYLSMDQRFLWWGFVRIVSRNYRLFSYPFAHRFEGRHTRPTGWEPHGLHGMITDRPSYFEK
jgi:glycerophosphoryl diester phosphodiesterase